MTTPPLQAVLDAFNAHDVDAILSFFTDDCILDTPRGERLVGKEQVSEWTIRGHLSTGEPIEVRGCDLFEFRDGKISRKDAYWKILD